MAAERDAYEKDQKILADLIERKKNKKIEDKKKKQAEA